MNRQLIKSYTWTQIAMMEVSQVDTELFNFGFLIKKQNPNRPLCIKFESTSSIGYNKWTIAPESLDEWNGIRKQNNGYNAFIINRTICIWMPKATTIVMFSPKTLRK